MTKDSGLPASSTYSTVFEAYGEYARRCHDPLILSGRNRFQGTEMIAAAADVLRKLAPKQHEKLLEIGCNIGLVLTRLAPHFASCTGQDHPDLLARYRQAGVPGNVTLHPGFWPEVQADGKFDCIVAYSVVQLMPDPDAARHFIRACYDKLTPGGRCLIGDLPNRDARKRFLESREGSEIARRYDDTRLRDRAEDRQGDYATRDQIHEHVSMPDDYVDDAFMLDLLREARGRGLEAYLMPQPPELPFCQSREDFLVVKRN